jgi:plasmid segregation protein ParM
MQIISTDMGRSESKFYSNNQKFKFRSVVGEWHQRNLNTDGSYDVSINNENYFIGDLALKESYLLREMSTESKIHEETKILCIVGISLLVQQNEIIVSTGLPINLFNLNVRDNLVALLKGNYTVTFKGFKPKQFSINQITVCPEGGGTYFYEAKKRPELKYGKVRCINVGSRTVNFCSIEDGNFINRDSGTLNYGATQLKNSKADHQSFARKIFADLSSKWINYNENEEIVILSGGGVISLDIYLKQFFKKVIVSDEPIYSDVLGFNEIAQAKYGRQIVAIAK